MTKKQNEQIMLNYTTITIKLMKNQILITERRIIKRKTMKFGQNNKKLLKLKLNIPAESDEDIEVIELTNERRLMFEKS